MWSFVLSKIVDLNEFKKNQNGVDNRALTPELIKEYKDTILLVGQHADSLTIEDWIHAYGMMLNFNHILMAELNKHLEE